MKCHQLALNVVPDRPACSLFTDAAALQARLEKGREQSFLLPSRKSHIMKRWGAGLESDLTHAGVRYRRSLLFAPDLYSRIKALFDQIRDADSHLLTLKTDEQAGQGGLDK